MRSFGVGQHRDLVRSEFEVRGLNVSVEPIQIRQAISRWPPSSAFRKVRCATSFVQDEIKDNLADLPEPFNEALPGP